MEDVATTMDVPTVQPTVMVKTTADSACATATIVVTTVTIVDTSSVLRVERHWNAEAEARTMAMALSVETVEIGETTVWVDAMYNVTITTAEPTVETTM